MDIKKDIKTVGEMPGCEGCPLRRLFPNNPFVNPQYPNPQTDLVRLMIGEAPGADEAEAGQPFVGGAGRVLNSLLSQAELPRDGFTIVNCIQCRPPDNVFPVDSAARSYIGKDEALQSVHQCIRNYVVPILESRSWKRVDLIGEKALRFIGLKTPISKWRGSPIEIDTEKIKESIEE